MGNPAGVRAKQKEKRHKRDQLRIAKKAAAKPARKKKPAA